MITIEQIEKANAVCCSAFKVSMLSDAMTLHRFMDMLCIDSILIESEQAYDDNDYFSYEQINSVQFDDAKLEQQGGMSYLVDVLASEFNVQDVEAGSLDELKDYIESSEFLRADPVDCMVDLGDIVRINDHNTQVSISDMAEFIEKCLKEDVPKLQANIVALAA